MDLSPVFSYQLRSGSSVLRIAHLWTLVSRIRDIYENDLPVTISQLPEPLVSPSWPNCSFFSLTPMFYAHRLECKMWETFAFDSGRI